MAGLRVVSCKPMPPLGDKIAFEYTSIQGWGGGFGQKQFVLP
jgi:hypothetical protein